MWTLPDRLSTLVARTLRHLGDDPSTPSTPLFTTSEIEGYYRDGLEELARATSFLWDRDVLEDQAPPCTHDFEWERSYITSRRKTVSAVSAASREAATNLEVEIHIRGTQATYTFEWERKHTFLPFGPGEVSFAWERSYAPTTSLENAAVVRLPEEALTVERSTWNDRRITPLMSRELEWMDRNYETGKGNVDGYTMDKDGLRSFRKWKIPSAQSSSLSATGVVGIPRGLATTQATPSTLHMHIDEWGMVFTAGTVDFPLSITEDFVPLISITAIIPVSWTQSDSPFASYSVRGDKGLLRRLPGYHPSRGVIGFARRISTSSRNTAIEYSRRPRELSSEFDIPELPAYVLRYVDFYARYRALDHDGPAHDPELAEHYRLRWEAGIQRVQERLNRVYSQRVIRLGGGQETRSGPAVARPPWDLDYGQVK